ncbi:MAG: hypothetical protein ACTS22_02515 [Phycisphaerales bacterium]
MRDDRNQPIPKHARPPLSWYLRPKTVLHELGSAGEAILIVLGGPPIAAFALGSWIKSTWVTPVWLDWGVFVVLTAGLYAALYVGIAYTSAALRSKGGAKRELLPLGRCPACTCSLRSIASEDDGCTVCPGCGCAWQAHTPAITAGKGSVVVDAAGTRRIPSPEFQAFRRYHREPRTGFQTMLAVPMWICFALTILGAAITPIPLLGMAGAFTVLLAGLGAVITWHLRKQSDVPGAAVAAALDDGRCPACWGEITAEQASCPACFAVWRIESTDANHDQANLRRSGAE